MCTFKIIAIPSEIADLVRTTLKAPQYGHPAHRERASGYGPCRHCLRTFHVGEEDRILFTYDPFDGLEPLPLPGPVFIHAQPCFRYDETAGFPEDMRSHRLTLNAYGNGRRVLFQKYVDDGAVESAINQLFQDPTVRYLHVRDTEAGCYDFRVERVLSEPG